MSVDIFSAILSSATIPLYAIGLLFLVYMIARSQLGLSLSGQIKQSMKTGPAQKRPKGPIGNYLVVFLLFALFTLLTITNQRRQRQ